MKSFTSLRRSASAAGTGHIGIPRSPLYQVKQTNSSFRGKKCKDPSPPCPKDPSVHPSFMISSENGIFQILFPFAGLYVTGVAWSRLLQQTAPVVLDFMHHVFPITSRLMVWTQGLLFEWEICGTTILRSLNLAYGRSESFPLNLSSKSFLLCLIPCLSMSCTVLLTGMRIHPGQ